MLGRVIFCLVLAAPLTPAGAVTDLAAGDPERGAKVYRKCKSCHEIGDDAKHKTGPALRSIVNAPVAAADGYDKYSKVLKALGEEGKIWDAETLDAFLTKPRAYAKGTRMTFSGLSKPKDRADLIAFLASKSKTAAEPAFSVAPEILAIEGDAEYGEYLSSECTTCHQADGGDDGIPAIIGWGTDDFATAMHAYREKHREHPVMQMISGRLSDDEIASLAVYFKGLGQSN